MQPGLAILLAASVAGAGCLTQPAADGDTGIDAAFPACDDGDEPARGQDPCAAAMATTASAGETTMSASPATDSATGAPSPCTLEHPCPLPDVADAPNVLLLVEPSVQNGTQANIRIRNVGDLNYTYSTAQASCELGIFTGYGRRLSQGVCSDLHTREEVAPGAEAAYFTWRLVECLGGGPWYGGCDAPRSVPLGTYYLRQTFCNSGPSQSHSATAGARDCTAAGASFVIE